MERPRDRASFWKGMIAMPERVEVMVEKEIDARGSFSPGPLIELLREVRGMPVGSELAVVSSDPGSVRVIPPWIRKARPEFLGAFPEQGFTRFVMRKTHEKRIWWRNTHSGLCKEAAVDL